MALTETSPDLKVDDKLYDVYCTISEAISKKRRVRYFTERIRFNKDNQTFANKISKGVLFTPKWLYQVKGELYMVGYSNTREKARAINLKSIVDIKLAPKFSR